MFKFLRFNINAKQILVHWSYYVCFHKKDLKVFTNTYSTAIIQNALSFVNVGRCVELPNARLMRKKNKGGFKYEPKNQ